MTVDPASMALVLFLALLPFGAFAAVFVGGMIVCRMACGHVDAFEAFERAIVFALAFAGFEGMAVMSCMFAIEGVFG